VERKDFGDGDIVLENDQLHITFDSSHGMMTVSFVWTVLMTYNTETYLINTLSSWDPLMYFYCRN
jgi:hypothetical protein